MKEHKMNSFANVRKIYFLKVNYVTDKQGFFQKQKKIYKYVDTYTYELRF